MRCASLLCTLQRTQSTGLTAVKPVVSIHLLERLGHHHFVLMYYSDLYMTFACSYVDAVGTPPQGTAGHRADPTNAFDRTLLAGARLTAAMRQAVEVELGFTVSAGIASNKVLAKLASSINKPNKQVRVRVPILRYIILPSSW